jgi:outer membrane protein W
MVISNKNRLSLLVGFFISVTVTGCGTMESSKGFPVIWPDDDLPTHHDISHQDVIPPFGGPVVEPALHDFHEKGKWGFGVTTAPHSSSDFSMDGAAALNESSDSAEALGLNLSYFAYNDFEVRFGYEACSLPTTGTSYQGIAVGAGDIDSTDLSLGFRHYMPLYRLRPYLGADLVFTDWSSGTGENPGNGETVRLSASGQTAIGLEAGVRYLWNAHSSVQLGLRWIDPIESGDGTATHKDAGGVVLNSSDDLTIDQSGWRIVFGVNWVF